jgi:hypothetical protein
MNEAYVESVGEMGGDSVRMMKKKDNRNHSKKEK